MLPISCIFMTTTRGHFDCKTRYLETLENLKKNDCFNVFSELIVHIKVTPGDNPQSIIDNFRQYGFKVLVTEENWKHWSPSHSLGQLKDLITVNQFIHQPFVYLQEDDFLIHCYQENFYHWLAQGIDELEENKNLMQLRIPRHKSDVGHYQTLEPRDSSHVGKMFVQGDLFSFNPNLCNSAYFNAACNLIQKNWVQLEHLINSGRLNSELAFTEYMAGISILPQCFGSYSADNIRALHIGTKEGEEDKP